MKNYNGCFADEIAIDFPSLTGIVERMLARFLGEEHGDVSQRGLGGTAGVARRLPRPPLPAPGWPAADGWTS
jgi:hypothetical protein